MLYGGDNVNMGVASGWRLDLGFWLDQEQRFGLQAGFFILQRQGSGFGAFSDDNGNPVLARPVIIASGGGESSYVDSLPGSLAGGVIVTNTSQFFGYESQRAFNILQTDHFRLDGIFGFRYLNLKESLEIDDQLYPLTSGSLTFLGAAGRHVEHHGRLRPLRDHEQLLRRPIGNADGVDAGAAGRST